MTVKWCARAGCLALGMAVLPTRAARAQSDKTIPPSAARDTTTVSSSSLVLMDSAFARARHLVMAGQTATGRQIGDSILAVTPPGTAAYGNALYGAAMLAPSAAAAQVDYERIIVDYPLSPHAGDALLQLAQLERSQGDRAGAINHLERFLRENPTSKERPRTGLWLAQMLFEQTNDLEACGVLDSARTRTPSDDIELLNQMNFYTARCAAAVANAKADSTARADSAKAAAAARADSERRVEARARSTRAETRSPAPPPGRYAVQLAAYATHAEAEKLVGKLRAHGIDARIEGDRKPFRVRAGRYRTRAEADRALARLKQRGYAGFVTTSDGH